ncbi:TniQ family protein [Paenibacillus oryzisoli]|uniref:TniQ family protein n=1 Tax=Paenibacillus oryzisoli TaxID=1850517 RepID=UPI003D2DAA36
MMNILSALPRRPRLFNDESLASYIYRLAIANSFETTISLYRLANLTENTVFTRTNHSQNFNKSLRPLCILSGKSETQLSSTIYNDDIPEYVLPIRKTKICPKCFADNPYGRKDWDILLNTICPVHQCLLLDHCPECKILISWYRKSMDKCRCGFNFCRAITPTVNKEETIFSVIVCDKYHPSLFQNQLLPGFFYTSSLSIIIDFIIFLIGQHINHSFGNKNLWGKGSLRGIRNSIIHTHLMELCDILKSLPHGIWEWTCSINMNLYYDKQRISDFHYRFFPYDISHFINDKGKIDINNIERFIYKMLIEGDRFSPITYT